jgi:hypothetical protein
MNYKKLSFASILTVLMIIVGCRGEIGPVGPSLSGSITGTVMLFNSDGSMPVDRSGVTVSIQGSSLSTTTDSLGLWTINNVMTGTYTITETKPGYGISEQQGFVFVGGSENDETPNRTYISLAQPPNFSVVLDSVKNVTDSAISIWFTMSGSFDTAVDQGENDFLVLIGKDSNVNGLMPNSYLYSAFTYLTPYPGVDGYNTISASDLKYAGFKSGESVYVVIYPLDHNASPGPSYSSYYDIATQKMVYTSLGIPSKVIRSEIP